MVNRSKAKGNAFESQVVQFLRSAGHSQAARTLAGSTEDRGDISGISNLVMQCKAHKEYSFGAWMAQAEKQAENAGVTRWVVVAKRKGKPDPAEAFAVIPLWLLAELLLEP